VVCVCGGTTLLDLLETRLRSCLDIICRLRWHDEFSRRSQKAYFGGQLAQKTKNGCLCMS
jgi:hypothetical protein